MVLLTGATRVGLPAILGVLPDLLSALCSVRNALRGGKGSEGVKK